MCVIDDLLQNSNVWAGGLRLSVGGGSVRGIRFPEDVGVTDKAQVLGKYVDSVVAVAALFGSDFKGTFNCDAKRNSGNSRPYPVSQGVRFQRSSKLEGSKQSASTDLYSHRIKCHELINFMAL